MQRWICNLCLSEGDGNETAGTHATQEHPGLSVSFDMAEALDVAPTATRWKPGVPRDSEPLPPMSPEHPMASTGCLACRHALANGQPVVIVALGPAPGDEHAIERHAAGRWHTAEAVAVHQECVGAVLRMLDAEPAVAPG